MKTILSLLFLIIWYVSVVAQTPQWKIYNTSNSKIPWNKFKSMVFDKNGDLWGAYDNSSSGPHLTRFDGDTFYNYINSGWVNYLAADKSGDIWFTTSNMELQKYGGNFVIYTHSLLSSPWMEPVYVDPAYNVWIGNRNNNSIVKFTGSDWTEYKSTNSIIPQSGILSMTSYKGDMWFGTTDSGLVKFGSLEKKVFKTTNSTLPSNRILALLEGKDDTLWFVCPGFLGYYDGSKFTTFANSNLKSANSLQMDSKGIMWISNPDFTSGGVYKYDRTSRTVYNKSNSVLPTNQLLDLKVDSKNNIWIATWGFGLVRMSPYASSVKETADLNFSIRPNPANKFILINTENLNPPYSYTIYDVHGKIKMQGKIVEKGMFQTDISELKADIYFLRLENENNSFVKKLIKIE